jgi:hypothetical protein
MRADLVEVSWDAQRSKWLFRIESGEEVLRRHSDAPKNADEQVLRTAAGKVLQDEGYEADPVKLSIVR